MATEVHLPGGDETIDLQQQVARLQALLEASRQVHSTIQRKRSSRAGSCASWCANWKWTAPPFPPPALSMATSLPPTAGTSILSWPLGEAGTATA